MSDVEQLNQKHMLAILDWYRGAGVDVCVSETLVNHFDQPAPHTIQAPTPLTSSNMPDKSPAPLSSTPKNQISQVGIDTAQGDPADAIIQAQRATNLEELRVELENIKGCALRTRATQMVFGEGNPDADIFFIGKAPSRDDDMLGQPFSGRAGQLLNNMLGAIGLKREQLYLSNIVPWRPPGNRDPAPQEIAMCLPFLIRQIELVAPKIIITLGELATKTLMGEQASLLKLRGQWSSVELGQHKAQALACLHPEFLLKQPAQKRQTWLDLQQIKQAITHQ